ncbi:MAG: SRPBCC family protein [Ardenticatenaceae bacterium]|nr:SRPBCC family protein [Ardenticatenaceae bacterium]
MTYVNVSIEILGDPEEIFLFISNPANNSRWQQGMISAEVTSPGPLGVGSTYKQIAKFLGRQIDSNFEIIAFEPGRMIKGTSVKSTFPITFTRIVEPAAREGYARVSAVVEGDASGVYRLFTPILDRLVKRSVEGDYARLKVLLEGETR